MFKEVIAKKSEAARSMKIRLILYMQCYVFVSFVFVLFGVDYSVHGSPEVDSIVNSLV